MGFPLPSPHSAGSVCRFRLRATISYVLVKSKLRHPPPGHLTVHRARVGGKVNVALKGWGI